MGVAKRSGLLGKSKEIYAPIQQLKDISEILGRAKESVEKGDLNATIEDFDSAYQSCQAWDRNDRAIL